MSRKYGVVSHGDEEFYLDVEEYENGHLNRYREVFDTLWEVLKDDERVNAIGFIYYEEYEGVCIQVNLVRGSTFVPGPAFAKDLSNVNNVVNYFISRWNEIPKEVDEKEQYEGVWKEIGKKIKFNRVYSNHRFTDEECEKLLNGETLILTLEGKSGEYELAGKLGKGYYGGFSYYGFIKDTTQARCPKSFAGHTFTEGELRLLNSGDVCFVEKLWSSRQNKYFNAILRFNKQLNKIEFVRG